MDVERLTALVALGEKGSMAAAAIALKVGQGTVRKRIAELEDDIGAPLVQRAGRGVVLTPTGELLARGGKDIVARADAIRDRVRTGAEPVLGNYRVATPVGMPPHLMALVITASFARFPSLRARSLAVARPLDLLPDEADIAVTFEPRPTEGPWLSAVVLRVQERVLASRDYVARRGAPRSIEALQQHTLLSWEPPRQSPEEWPLRDGGAVPVSCALISPDVGLIRECMLAGMGIARVLDHPVPELEGPESLLVPVLPSLLGRELALRVVMPDTPKMREPFRLFLGNLREGVEAI